MKICRETRIFLCYDLAMKILVCNDDGIDFKGLRTLVKVFSTIGDVYVVAPNGECSSNSHHLTIKGRVAYEKRDVPFAKEAYALWGTPADCVHMAMHYFFDERFDLVVSGINKGANVSTDIIYSGTIAAAREAFIYHVPSMALSLDSFTADDYTVAAEYGRTIALKYLKAKDNSDYFLNVNVPCLEEKGIKGILVCDRIGEILYEDSYTHTEEDGKDYIQILPSRISYNGDREDLRIDVAALAHGYVSVSPLGNEHIDHKYIEDVTDMLKG